MSVMNDPCRLYIITPARIKDIGAFKRLLDEALGAGDVGCVQLRLKSDDGAAAAPDDDVLAAAAALLPIAKKHDTAFLINDRPDLAARAGADGVHVGQGDMSCREAREILGSSTSDPPHPIVGVTCHASRHLALEAGEAGADYVAFGAFFPTQTKATNATPEPALLAWWRNATTVPAVAIGGISPENCGALVTAGADFLAVSSAIWNDEAGPGAAVRRFSRAIGEAMKFTPAG